MSNEKEVVIRQLIEITNVSSLMEDMMTQAEQAWGEVNITPSQKSGVIEKFVEKFIPVMMEVYTLEEAQALVDFYSTDVGASILKKMPLINQASLELGVEMGEALINEELSGHLSVVN